MKKEVFQELLEQYYRISNSIVSFRNVPFSFNGSQPVLTASMHLIDMIVKHPESNLTEYANLLGITKGAVSQMAANLEKKGLIVKLKSEEDGRSYRFQLTDEGMKIYEGHENMHKAMYGELRKELEKYTEEDLAKTKRILDIISKSMDSYKEFK